MKNASFKEAVGYVTAGNIFISIGPFFVEFSGLDAVGNTFYRMFIGGIAFLLIAAFRKEPLPNKRFLWVYGLAAIAIVVDLLLYNQSILYIGSGLSTVLSNLEVVFLILIGAAVYKEKLGQTFVITSFLIIAGVLLLIEPYLHMMHTHIFLGIAFALFASFTFSIYLLLLRIIEKKTPETSSASNLGIICMLGTIILGILIAYLPEASFSLPKNWSGIFCVLIYSFISQVCGWWLVSKGIGKLNLATSGVLFLLQPALTFLCDCLIFGRNTGVFQIVGCLVLLASIYKTMSDEERRKVTT